ncbi:MAG: wax ester/triacylglycerol synthase family O-acyltransferase, partial [Acidimicrobiia bacterium]|nr:wax ester/triacylglycerol synthase family O-acyltransferase [Acidimicrobiia bacterium]
MPDPAFDSTHHVRTVSLPAPGSRAQLYELCEQLQMLLLDRDRPLFELWFVTGLDPDEFGPGAVALVEKVHHALLDGMSGVEVLSVLFDPVPVPLETAPLPPVAGPRPPGPAERARRALGDQLTWAVAAGQLAGAVARRPRRVAGQLAAVGGAIGDVAANPFGARPSLNRPVGRYRRLQTVPIPLEPVRQIGSRLGATVNDVLLALITAGLRALLLDRDEPLPPALAALVPVSTRRAGLAGETGNRVSALIIDLPVREPDPV